MSASGTPAGEGSWAQVTARVGPSVAGRRPDWQVHSEAGRAHVGARAPPAGPQRPGGASSRISQAERSVLSRRAARCRDPAADYVIGAGPERTWRPRRQRDGASWWRLAVREVTDLGPAPGTAGQDCVPWGRTPRASCGPNSPRGACRPCRSRLRRDAGLGKGARGPREGRCGRERDAARVRGTVHAPVPLG